MALMNTLYWLAGPLGPLLAWRIGQTYGRKLGRLIRHAPSH